MFFKKKKSDWNDEKLFSKVYTNPIFSQNRILAKNVYLNMDQEKTRRNNNVAFFGRESQSRQFIQQNMLQANCNWIVPDENGVLLHNTKDTLVNAGYQIHIIDCTDTTSCIPYDFIAQYHGLKDGAILQLMQSCLSMHYADAFSRDVDAQLLNAIVIYMNQHQAGEMSINQAIQIMNSIAEDEDNCLSNLPETDISRRLYDAWNTICRLPKNRAASVQRLLNAMSSFTSGSEFKWADLRTGKHAVFLLYHNQDTFEPLCNIMSMQAFVVLQEADMPVHTTIVAQTYHSELSRYMATGRKKNISFIVTADTIIDIRNRVKFDTDFILGNCDALVCANVQEINTAEWVSKALGKKQIALTGRQKRPGNIAYCYNAPDLMSIEEILQMQHNERLVLIRGCKPFRTYAYMEDK